MTRILTVGRIKAATIIWIAQKIQEEHRAAIDWLNEITPQQVNFFAVEIQLWRIGDSPAAPTFNVVAKPNNWTRYISEQKQLLESQELTPTRQIQLEYWTAFAEYVLNQSSVLRPRKARPRSYLNFAIGRQNFYLTGTIYFREKKVVASLTVVGPENYRLLLGQRKQIESAVGTELLWDERPTECYISTENLTDPATRELWDEQHSWLCTKLELLHKVFSPIVRSLSKSEDAVIDEAADLDPA